MIVYSEPLIPSADESTGTWTRLPATPSNESSKVSSAEVELLLDLWEQHDRIERAILYLSRRFTDEQLDELQDTGGIAGLFPVRTQDGDDSEGTSLMLPLPDDSNDIRAMLQMRMERHRG